MSSRLVVQFCPRQGSHERGRAAALLDGPTVANRIGPVFGRRLLERAAHSIDISADSVGIHVQFSGGPRLDLRRYEANRLAAALTRAAWSGPGPSGDPLSQAEFSQMLELIKRYADTEMDQWEAWSLRSEWGRIYVNVTRAEVTSDAYTDLDYLLPPGR